jgi:hypothetical protein
MFSTVQYSSIQFNVQYRRGDVQYSSMCNTGEAMFNTVQYSSMCNTVQCAIQARRSSIQFNFLNLLRDFTSYLQIDNGKGPGGSGAGGKGSAVLFKEHVAGAGGADKAAANKKVRPRSRIAAGIMENRATSPIMHDRACSPCWIMAPSAGNSQCLRSYWSHIGYILGVCLPIGHT